MIRLESLNLHEKLILRVSILKNIFIDLNKNVTK